MPNQNDARKALGTLRLVTWPLQILTAVEAFTLLNILVFSGAAQAGMPMLPYELVPAYDMLRQGLYILPWLLLALLMAWTYLVSKETRELSTEELENSAGLSAFFYIIPILSLWKPWEVMRELYQANRSPANWKGSGKAAIVGWWWWFRIIGNVLGILVSMMVKSGGADDIGIAAISLILMAITLVALCLQLIIVRRIAKWQAGAVTQPTVAEVF